jgi:hypothetical protein
MSRLRKEKNCLNCGHHVEEIYCSHCGQKNIVTHVNALYAIGEFAADYFHADGKFLKSIPALLFHPGKMTNEFNAGKREKYIHPFRLYIFISIVYFSISFIIDDSSIVVRSGNPSTTQGHIRLGDSGIISIQRTDSALALNDTSIDLLEERAAKLPGTIKLYRDSVKKLPESARPDFRNDVINRVSIKYKNEGNEGKLIEASVEKFRHTLPRFLFFLMPLAALLLKLFYIRRKRFYIDHLVHTLYLHSFIFLIMTTYALLHLLLPGGILFTILFFFTLAYFFISMKKVYGQSRIKTILKGTLLAITYSLCLAFIFGIGFLYIFIYD